VFECLLFFLRHYRGPCAVQFLCTRIAQSNSCAQIQNVRNATPTNSGDTQIVFLADPTSSPEDWESDFDFDAPLFPTQTHRQGPDKDGPISNTTATSTVLSNTERRELEKLLSTLPDLSFDESLLEELDNHKDLSRKGGGAGVGKDKLALKDLLRDIHASSKLFDRHIELLALSTKEGGGSAVCGAETSKRSQSISCSVGGGGVGKGGDEGGLCRRRLSLPTAPNERVLLLEQELAEAVADKNHEAEVRTALY
jgi:hypothetical protein